MKRSRVLIATIPLALAAMACAPEVPLELSMRESSVDIAGVKGRKVIVPAAPLVTRPGALPQVPFAPRDLPTDVPAIELCPKAEQFAVPELAADPTITAPPVAAKYSYRVKGDFSTGGAISIDGSAPPIGVREVIRGSAADGYDFVVAEAGGTGKRSTAFRIVPPSGSPLAQPGGLYVVAMDWEDVLLGKAMFRPTQPMLLLPLPVVRDQQFTAVGVDPQHQISIKWQGSVSGTERIDACGSLVEAWVLDLSQMIVTSGGEFNTTSVLKIATQYGGLSVADTVAMTGVRANALATAPQSQIRSVIDRVPERSGG